jgi:hypothetical protein
MINIFRILFGFHSIKDGSTCELSEQLWDCHDYHKSKGGDGFPSHFHEYTCPKCNKRFSI